MKTMEKHKFFKYSRMGTWIRIRIVPTIRRIPESTDAVLAVG